MLHELYDGHIVTHRHSLEVYRYADELADYAAPHWTREDRNALAIGALLHDIGKLDIPKEILDSPGKLTPEEFRQIMTHPERGISRVQNFSVPFPRIATDAILYHHEVYARSAHGYPTGLWGEDIPLAARIVAVADDVFEALTAERSYKPAMEYNQAIDILLAEAGNKLDPLLVHLFVKNVVAQAA